MTNPDEKMLEDLFADAREARVTVSDDLMARVLNDAADVQRDATLQPRHVSPVSVSPFDRLMNALGGWPAVSGFAAATVAGFWIGVAPPVAFEDYAASFTGDVLTVGALSDDSLFDEDLIDG